MFAQEYEDLLTRYRVRNEVVANEKLGETLESKLEQTKNKFPFVYGMNKEATQLAILLKHLQEEELANDPGLNVTKDMRKLVSSIEFHKCILVEKCCISHWKVNNAIYR